MADIFGVCASRLHNQEQGLLCNSNAPRTELWKWYDDYHSEHPNANLSRLQTLKPSMLGTHKDPTLRTEAAETFGLLTFSPGHGVGSLVLSKSTSRGWSILRYATWLEFPCTVDGGIPGLKSVSVCCSGHHFHCSAVLILFCSGVARIARGSEAPLVTCKGEILLPTMTSQQIKFNCLQLEVVTIQNRKTTPINATT